MKTSWPIEIHGVDISLRPLRFRDRAQWNRVRAENRDWLSPWEATIPLILSFEARHGRSLSFAIWHGSQLIGQITLGGIMYGAMRGGHIGYWIDRNFANRGYTTQAVEILTQYGFSELKLHRLEINLRPENGSSRRVAEKAGYIFEGERPRYLHIDGQWRDHITFVKENSAIK